MPARLNNDANLLEMIFIVLTNFKVSVEPTPWTKPALAGFATPHHALRNALLISRAKT